MSREASQPPDAVRAKLFAAIAREPSRPRRAQNRLLVFAWIGVAAFLVVMTFAAGIRLGERSPGAVVFLVLAWAGMGLISLWAASLRKSMVGRPVRDCITVLAIGTLGGLATIALLAQFESPPPGSGRAIGCLVAALALGVVPTGVLVWARRQAGGAVAGSEFVGASLGVVGALAGGLVVALHCPDGNLRHLVLGHVGVVPIAALVGALALGRVLRPRAPRR